MCSEISKWTSKQIHSVQKDLDEALKLKNLYWHTLCWEQNDVTAVSENPNHQALWGMDSKLHQKSKLRLLKLLFLIKELVPAKEKKNHKEIFINSIVLKMVLKRKSTAWSKPINDPAVLKHFWVGVFSVSFFRFYCFTLIFLHLFYYLTDFNWVRKMWWGARLFIKAQNKLLL